MCGSSDAAHGHRLLLLPRRSSRRVRCQGLSDRSCTFRPWSEWAATLTARLRRGGRNNMTPDLAPPHRSGGIWTACKRRSASEPPTAKLPVPVLFRAPPVRRNAITTRIRDRLAPATPIILEFNTDDLLPHLARYALFGSGSEKRPVAHRTSDSPGKQRPVAWDGLDPLAGLDPGRPDGHGAAERAATVCACPLAGAAVSGKAESA